MLVQMAGIAHAVTDSFHEEHIQESIFLGNNEATLEDKETTTYSEHAQNCHHSCHAHCHSHLYMNYNSSDFSFSAKEMYIRNQNELFTGLVHGPDSPPPNFS